MSGLDLSATTGTGPEELLYVRLLCSTLEQSVSPAAGSFMRGFQCKLDTDTHALL